MEERSIQTLEKLVGLCHAHLSASHKAYFQVRGITKETMDVFELGSFPTDLIVNQLNVVDLEDLGVISSSKGHLKRRSMFTERVIFPIRDAYGRAVAISGRILDSDISDKKYFNSHYPKYSVLFGMDKAKQYIFNSGFAFVVEGNMDMISMYQAGLKNTVALCGTALTLAHIRLLVRYCHNVVVLTDNDEAGSKSYDRVLKKFGYLSDSKDISFLRMKVPRAYKDVDEYIRSEGSEAIKSYTHNLFGMFVRSSNPQGYDEQGLMWG